MDPAELLLWFGALAIPASIGFAWRITVALQRISTTQLESLTALRQWQKEIVTASNERKRYEEDRAKLQSETKAGVDRLLEMHLDADKWGFGTGAVAKLLADSNETLRHVATAVSRQADCQEDSQTVLRWLIENSKGIPSNAIPPPIRKPKVT